jgi:O-antigen ligase
LSLPDLRAIAQPREYSPAPTDRVYRLVSIYLSVPLARAGASPNAITLAWIVLGLGGVVGVGWGGVAPAVTGALLLQLSYLLDFVDGEVARLTDRRSATGGYLDLLGHALIKPSLLLAAGAGAASATGSPRFLLAGAVGAVAVAVGDNLRFYAACTLADLKAGDLGHAVTPRAGGGGGGPSGGSRASSSGRPSRAPGSTASSCSRPSSSGWTWRPSTGPWPGPSGSRGARRGTAGASPSRRSRTGGAEMWLLLLMIFIMPFEQSPYLTISDSFLGIFTDFTVIKLLGLIGFVWAGLAMASGRDTGLLSARQARFFLVFYLCILLAGLASGSGFLVVQRYLAFLLFLPFVLITVRTQDDLRRVLTAMVLSLVLVFPYAVRQMLRYDARLGVGLYETNYYAANLLLVIPLAFALARQQGRTVWKLGLALGGATLVLSLFLTSSRGGFLGLLAAGLIFAYRRRGIAAAAGLFVALIVGAFAFSDLGIRAVATFDGAAAEPAGLEASNRAHVALFWAALQMIAEAPLTGVGPDRFRELSDLYTGLGRGYIAHNSYLEIAAELGLPVLAIFLGLLLATFAALGRAARLRGRRDAVELAQWADALRIGLVGFLVAGAFISAQYEKRFWIVVFLSIVVDRLARRHARDAGAVEPTPETRPRSGRLLPDAAP